MVGSQSQSQSLPLSQSQSLPPCVDVLSVDILEAVTVKGNSTRPVKYVILDRVCTNALIFLRFVCRLLVPK